MQKGTVAICFVHKALEALHQRGLNGQALLSNAGIATELLALPQARVSAATYSALWRLVNQAMDDEFFGQDSRRMKVGTFAMLCHSVIGCSSLEQALQRALRFFNLVLDDLRCTLAHDVNDASVILHVRSDTPTRIFAQETLLVMIHGLMCWLVARRVTIREVYFAYARPSYSVEYQSMFSPKMSFDQPATMIIFDESALSLRVVQTESSLKQFLRTAPEGVVLKYKNQSGISSKVRERLKTRRPLDWPSFDDLATGLKLTSSTLRRRLAEEGQSYRLIADDLRRDKAIDLLSHTDKTIGEIAIDLGFAEPSAFHRAFKKWTGAKPGVYRTVR